MKTKAMISSLIFILLFSCNKQESYRVNINIENNTSHNKYIFLNSWLVEIIDSNNVNTNSEIRHNNSFLNRIIFYDSETEFHFQNRQTNKYHSFLGLLGNQLPMFLYLPSNSNKVISLNFISGKDEVYTLESKYILMSIDESQLESIKEYTLINKDSLIIDNLLVGELNLFLNNIKYSPSKELLGLSSKIDYMEGELKVIESVE